MSLSYAFPLRGRWQSEGLTDEVRPKKYRQINERTFHLIHRFAVPLPLKGKAFESMPLN